MACSSCAAKARQKKLAEQANNSSVGVPIVTQSNLVKSSKAVVVEASDTTEKVTLRYYGGGTASTKTRGCRSCGGSTLKYATITSERIQFASEDAPNGYFNLLVTIGHDYLVTRKQADYMLTLTFVNQAGREIHKFKEV